LLLDAAGVDAATGQPSDCYQAGRVRLRAQQDASQQQLALRVEGDAQQLQLGSDPSGWPAGAVSSFVAAARNDESTALPRSAARLASACQCMAWAVLSHRSAPSLAPARSKPLSQSLVLGGATARLSAQWEEGRGPVRSFGWPAELWPWNPNGSPCPDTELPDRMYLAGGWLGSSAAVPPWARGVPSDAPSWPWPSTAASRLMLNARAGAVNASLPAYRRAAPPLVSGSFQGSAFHVPAFRASPMPGGTVTLRALSSLQVGL
jgi:hypothetical protein